MEKDLVNYIKRHTFTVAMLVVGAFLLLAAGEYLLYRKTQELNRMVSEGMMQIKEELKGDSQYFDEMMMDEEMMFDDENK